MNSYLNTIIDKAYCINMDRRPDRWSEVSSEFDRIGLPVERISAVDHSVYLDKDIDELSQKERKTLGHRGCAASHYMAMNKAIEDGVDRFIIFEDDVMFESFFEDRLKYEWENNLPDNWDVVFLGGLIVSDNANKISNNLYDIDGAYCAHANIYKTESLDPFLYTLEEYFEKDYRSIPQDTFLVKRGIYSKVNSYIFYPSIAYQRGGYSDVEAANRVDRKYFSKRKSNEIGYNEVKSDPLI